MKSYNKYKKVDLPWIDEIPEHWLKVRNKNIFKTLKECVGEEYNDYRLLSLTKSGVIFRDMESGKGKFPASFATYKKVKKDNIIFCLFDIDETPRTVGLSSYDGMITGAYDIFEINKDVFSKYIYYYYLSIDDKKALKPYYKSLRKTIAIDDFNSLSIYLPPFEEQEKIAKFLDYKVRRIDELIELEEKKQDKMKAMKQSIISDAVTRGLNPDVKMKDSGVDWIGEIPEHWEVVKVKRLFKIKKEIAGKEGYKVLSITQNGIKIKDVSINEGQMALDYSNYQFVYPGDYAMNHMDLLTGYIDCSNYFGVTSPDYRVFEMISNNNSKKYYLYIFQLCYNRHIFYRYGHGASSFGRWRLSSTEFLNFNILVPSIKEQQEIADYLDKKTSEIDRYISKIDEKIEKLKSLKQSLISEVVTGQIDLRDYNIPEED